jgi:uncharacterized protein YjbJ (UPF0337 family)
VQYGVEADCGAAPGGQRNPRRCFPFNSSANATLKEIAVMAGTTDKAKGLLKEAAGKATGNKRMESEGKVDRAKGKAKDVAHEVTESSKGVRDSLKKG